MPRKVEIEMSGNNWVVKQVERWVFDEIKELRLHYHGTWQIWDHYKMISEHVHFESALAAAYKILSMEEKGDE